jgi:hypothetical protein
MPLSSLSKNILAMTPQQDERLQVVLVQAFSHEVSGLVGIPDFIWTQPSGAKLFFKGVRASFETDIHSSSIETFHVLTNTDSFDINEPSNDLMAHAGSIVGQIKGTLTNNNYHLEWNIQGAEAVILSAKRRISVTLDNFEAHRLAPDAHEKVSKILNIISTAKHVSLSVYNQPWLQGQNLSSKADVSGDFDMTDLLTNFQANKKWTAATQTELAELTNINAQSAAISLKDMRHKLNIIYSPEKKSYISLFTMVSATVKASDGTGEIVENNIEDKIIFVAEMGKNKIVLHDFNSGAVTGTYNDIATLKIPTIKSSKNNSDYVDGSQKQNYSLTIPTTTINITRGDQSSPIEFININAMNNISTDTHKISSTYMHFNLNKITFLNDSIGPIDASAAVNNIQMEHIKFDDVMKVRYAKNTNHFVILPNSTYVGQTTVSSPYGNLVINENVTWNTQTPISSMTARDRLLTTANVIGNARISIAMLDHYIDTVAKAMDGGAGNIASILKNYVLIFVRQGYLKVDKTDYISDFSVKDAVLYLNGINMMEFAPRSASSTSISDNLLPPTQTSLPSTATHLP